MQDNTGNWGRWMRCASIAVAAALSGQAGTAWAANCHGLTGKVFDDATVIETDEITHPFSLGSLGTTPGRGVAVDVPFCRVRGTLKPTADSDIRFEVWLPAPDVWNARYQGIGNGGFAGSLTYGGMAWALKGGYAVAASDTGHSGTAAESAWAVGHPEKIVDLGWRSVHETAVAAKAIIAAYYGRPATKAYYSGCSTGGRQGLVLAQRFPDDYDGIVVGAPANYWPRLLAKGAGIYQALRADPARWLSPDKLTLLNAASLKACHGKKGLIDDPGACRFDPKPLLCKPKQATGCLNASELAMVRIMYGGVFDAAGNNLYPGFTPGNEAAWSVWSFGKTGRDGHAGLTYPIPVGFYGNLVHQDPTWTLDQFDLARDLAAAEDGPVGAAAYAENPDLRAFFARGGKLLQYHGWNDPAIPAQSSLRYYGSVARGMAGTGPLRDSYRLFLGTGMQHCAGGPGPNAVGGASGPPPPVRDAAHDMVAALRHWVEDKVAPEQIIATKYVENDPAKPIEGQRPWCAWPAAPMYRDGDRALATSYACKPPRGRFAG